MIAIECHPSGLHVNDEHGDILLDKTDAKFLVAYLQEWLLHLAEMEPKD